MSYLRALVPGVAEWTVHFSWTNAPLTQRSALFTFRHQLDEFLGQSAGWSMKMFRVIASS
jgi:hypothetical protein